MSKFQLLSPEDYLGIIFATQGVKFHPTAERITVHIFIYSFSGTSQNSLEQLVDNCNVEQYIKESENIDESENQDDGDIYTTKELWEECDNQEFSEDHDLTEHVCIIMFCFLSNK